MSKTINENYETLLKECKDTCNSMPASSNYNVHQSAYGVVISTIRKALGHGTDKDSLAIGRAQHMKFLSWLFDRAITTSKVDNPEGPTAAEAFGILKWAQPGKLHEDLPWACHPKVKKTLYAFEIVHLGQLEMELPE